MTTKEIRDLYMASYMEHKDEIDTRIAEGIEKYRKGYCKIRVTDEEGRPVPGVKIALNQKNHEFKFGANIFMLDEFDNEKDNQEYRRFFKEYFNLATVPFYWDTLEPEEGKPRYDKKSPKIYRRPATDLCVDYCEQNGIMPKLHCLVYDKFIPAWLRDRDLKEIKEKYANRFREIAERYTDRLFEVEVINEMLITHGWTGLCSQFTYERDIIEWSFETARRYFPDETLVINEGNPIQKLGTNGYYAPYFIQCEKLLMEGVSIDKIGLQNHLFTGASAHTPEEYEASVREGVPMNDPVLYYKGLDTIAALGKPLELTEVTVPTFGDTLEDEQLQADMLRLWYSVWFSHPAVNTIVYWNTVDGYAYQGSPNWIENNCRGGLWHHDLTPKLAAKELYRLVHEEWHTQLELVTDEEGYAEFRGFYGDYDAVIGEETYEVCLYPNSYPLNEIEV